MLQFGTYTDTRDGHVYRTVLMPDGNWWTAENLAWDGSGVDYDNNPANRAIYGRLYSNGEAPTAIPTDWHLADYSELETFAASVGRLSVAGKRLKKNSPLWSPNTGTDDCGFALLPSGYQIPDSNWFMGLGESCIFLTGYIYICFFAAANNDTLYYSQLNGLERGAVRAIVDFGNIPNNPFPILTPCTLQMLCDSKVANSSSGRRGTVSRDSSFVFSTTLNLPSECEQFESVPYYNFPAIGDCEIRQLDLVKYTFRDTEKASSVKCIIIPGLMNKRTGDFRISCEPNISVDEAMLVATGSSSLEVLSSSRALSLKCVWTVSFLAATQFIEWLRGSVNRIFTTSVAGMKGVACQIGDSVSLEIGSTDVKISADLAIVNTKQFPLNVTASRVGNVVTVSAGVGYTGTLVNRLGEIVEVVTTLTNILTFATYPENCYLLIRNEAHIRGRAPGNNVTEWLEL